MAVKEAENIGAVVGLPRAAFTCHAIRAFQQDIELFITSQVCTASQPVCRY